MTWQDKALPGGSRDLIGYGPNPPRVKWPDDARVAGHVIAREDGVVAGLGLVSEVYRQLDERVEVTPLVAEGAHVGPATRILAISGHYANVGLVGERISVPLLPRVNREQTFHGSYWGNNVDLMEVLSLAAQDKIRHTTNLFKFGQINEYLDRMRAGEIVGRAVMTW